MLIIDNCTFVGPRAMVNEYSCVCLHSDRSRAERQENLSSFKVCNKSKVSCSLMQPWFEFNLYSFMIILLC